MTTLAQSAPGRNRPAAGEPNAKDDRGSGTSSPPATIIAEWPVNSREWFRVAIEQYNGTWLFSARKWFEADDGSIRPGKHGLGIGVRHLPRIVEAAAAALQVARDHGLIGEADHGGGDTRSDSRRG